MFPFLFLPHLTLFLALHCHNVFASVSLKCEIYWQQMVMLSSWKGHMAHMDWHVGGLNISGLSLSREALFAICCSVPCSACDHFVLAWDSIQLLLTLLNCRGGHPNALWLVSKLFDEYISFKLVYKICEHYFSAFTVQNKKYSKNKNPKQPH